MQSITNDKEIRLIRINLILGLVEGIFVILFLLAIPSERENAGILGYSNTRILFLSILVIGTLFFLTLLIKSFINTAWPQSIIDYLEINAADDKLTGFYLFITVLFFVASGILFLIWANQTADKFLLGYFVRLTPIVCWITALALQSLFVLIRFGYGKKFSLKSFRIAYFEFKTWIKSTNLNILLGIIIVILGTTFSAFFVYFPSYHYLFIEEDYFLENFSAGLFILSFSLSVFIILKNKWWKLTAILLSFTSLWAFLEEISYGERFSTNIPEIIPEENVDALHDYFEIAYYKIRPIEFNFVIYLLISLFILGCFLAVRYMFKHGLLKPLTAKDPLFFIIISGAFIVIGLFLDLDLYKSELIVFIEELLEFFSSIALFIGAVAIYQNIELEKESKAE